MIYFRIMTVYFDKLLSMLCASAHVLAGTLFVSHLWLSTCVGLIVVDLHNTSDLNPFYYYVCGFRQPILFCLGCRSTQKMRHYTFTFLSFPFALGKCHSLTFDVLQLSHDDEKEKNNNRCLHFFLTRSCKESSSPTGLNRVINGW